MYIIYVNVKLKMDFVQLWNKFVRSKCCCCANRSYRSSVWRKGKGIRFSENCWIFF